MTTLPEEAVKAMPERIYAKVHGASTDVISGQRGLIGGWNEHQRDGQAEYVRSDLYAALEAQLAEARKALEQAEQQLDYGQVNAAHRILISTLSSPDHADAGKVEGDGWMPIESAPRDGTEIIYLTKYGSIGFCLYVIDDINDWDGWWDLQADDEVYPKHWLPRSALPSAPASEGAE